MLRKVSRHDEVDASPSSRGMESDRDNLPVGLEQTGVCAVIKIAEGSADFAAYAKI